MPTDDIQTELIEPDSPNSSPKSQNSHIPELWSHATHKCHLHVIDDRWNAVIDTALAGDFWRAAKHIPEAHSGSIFDFGLIWTGAEHIQSLNGGFRGKDQPTNVLSFPDGTTDPETGEIYLGDIFLCWDVMAQEATNQQISLRNHTLHLMLHGLLHLLGYDHMTSDEAASMEQLETKLLAKIHVPDPYAADPIQAEII